MSRAFSLKWAWAALAAVVECELLGVAFLDEDVLGDAAEHKATGGPGLPRRDDGAGNQPGDHDAPVFVGHIQAVVRADHSAAAVSHKELHASDGRSGVGDVLLDRQRLLRRVVEGERLAVVGSYNNGLRPCPLVNGIAGERLRLGHDQRAGDAHDRDHAVGVRFIDAVA